MAVRPPPQLAPVSARRRRALLGCRCRQPPPAMVHAGPAARAPSRAMFTAAETKPRRAVSPLGIPKSPSFHSGLDLVANQATTKRSESVSDVARAFRFALFTGAGMEGQVPLQKAPSPPDARSPPPLAPAAVSPDRLISNADKESLMVQLPLLKGSSIHTNSARYSTPPSWKLQCLLTPLFSRNLIFAWEIAASISDLPLVEILGEFADRFQRSRYRIFISNDVAYECFVTLNCLQTSSVWQP